MMMIKYYEESVAMNDKPNWSYISDHHYKILTVGGSGLDKTNVLLN